ncbi:MAG: 5-methyltetrahydrofolate--homocysteine methyltransferase [Bacteroidaceae bacterium]|nr:5-methyltetrahydrofolate--homocysteine methyltransferase [Bacteroidaceae bacterium]
MKNVQRPTVHEVSEYINWLYFFHAWGFAPRYAAVAQIHDCQACKSSWVHSFPLKEQAKAMEACKLLGDARQLLKELDEVLFCQCTFKLFDANADGDNILIGDTVFPLLRQQLEHKPGEPYLCLSDFIMPLSTGRKDKIGVFAASVDDSKLTDTEDSYRKLLIETLCDRLVEAAVEKLHLFVRREAWGYAPDERLTIQDLLQEKFQGIRPAVGYPSLPDQSVNFIIDKLIDLKQVGITLTENGAMNPHASVSGLMLAHPQAKYFSVGKIGKDQLTDYSQRRGLPAENMRKFLAANL